MGSGRLDAERRRWDLDFRLGGVGRGVWSDGEPWTTLMGSSSSKIPGKVGGRAILMPWGDVGLPLLLLSAGRRRALGEGGVGGCGASCGISIVVRR